MKMKLLWVVDGTAGQLTERDWLERVNGLAFDQVAEPAVALDLLASSFYDVVLIDFPLPGWTPEEWLEEVQRINSRIPVVIREERPNFAAAVRLTKLGAYHYIGDPLAPQQLLACLEEAVQQRRHRERLLYGAAVTQEPWRDLLVGESRAIRNIVETIRLVAARRCTVLITGETGTGKEVVARSIHMASTRRELPMVAVNCCALPEHLMEAELFGHVKGAFTGAIRTRIGRFEQAHRSTLFLDEIGDMPLELQAKILRVLQERQIQRLGSSESVPVDVRVLAASNVDLGERTREGRFREDLYYRLNVVPIRVPPLAERASDIPLLVHHFIDKICRQEGIPGKEITQEALDRLCSYSWPGNVRQLENAVEMAVVLSGNRDRLFPSDFPLPSPAQWKADFGRMPSMIALPDEGLDFTQVLRRLERSLLEQALKKSGGNKKLAARLLRLKRTTFAAKLKAVGAEQ